ncbi:MFS transporter [Nocardioides sp.]|uniref:MFS transporter n=1 Tax=Nocardioides sp. TaxID=35761 RepID=UPI002BCCBABB|nr:MFS transporter [Nocardioides sp.]HXH80218.1 MFS transporter [Nocardioides sp.]
MTTNAVQPLTRWGVPLEPTLRTMALGQFANRFAAGALMTTSALYFTRQQGFTATEVGLALSVSAFVGLLVTVPAGHLADTRGPTRVLTWLMLGAALTAWPPAFAPTPVALAVLLSVQSVFLSGSGAVYHGVIAQLATGGRGVQFKAYLRAVTNTAIGLGSMVGGLALLVDEDWAYISVFFAQAVLTGFAAWNTTRLPRLPAYARAEGEPRLAVLRDRPYAVLMGLHTLFVTHFFIIEIGLVLFIAERTTAPTVLVSATLVLNTVLVALLQVRLTRHIETVVDGSRALVLGGWLVAGGFVLIGFAEDLDVWAACALLLLGTVVHVFGEIVGSGGQWSHQMGLAPHERQGQYQGFASLSFGAARVIGPPVAAFFCVGLGRTGWIALAVAMVVISYAMAPVARWALATRADYGVTTHSG